MWTCRRIRRQCRRIPPSAGVGSARGAANHTNHTCGLANSRKRAPLLFNYDNTYSCHIAMCQPGCMDYIPVFCSAVKPSSRSRKTGDVDRSLDHKSIQIHEHFAQLSRSLDHKSHRILQCFGQIDRSPKSQKLRTFKSFGALPPKFWHDYGSAVATR